MRCTVSESYENLILFVIHISFLNEALLDGNILIIFSDFILTRILLQKLSNKSNVSIFVNSHGRAVNEKGLDVNAPTGHKSITLPLNSVRSLVCM
jgi:hypothetical protein